MSNLPVAKRRSNLNWQNYCFRLAQKGYMARNSLKFEVVLIEVAVAPVHTGGRWCTVPLVLIRIFVVAGELLRHVSGATFLSVHHVASMEGLILQLEGRVVVFTLAPLLLLCLKCILCVLRRGVLAWERIDVRSEDEIVSVALLTLNVRALTQISHLKISCLDAIQADGWAGQRRDGRREVPLTASSFAHLVLTELFFLAEIEIIIMLPEAVSAGLVRSSEILRLLKALGWIFCLILSQSCT